MNKWNIMQLAFVPTKAPIYGRCAGTGGRYGGFGVRKTTCASVRITSRKKEQLHKSDLYRHEIKGDLLTPGNIRCTVLHILESQASSRYP